MMYEQALRYLQNAHTVLDRAENTFAAEDQAWFIDCAIRYLELARNDLSGVKPQGCESSSFDGPASAREYLEYWSVERKAAIDALCARAEFGKWSALIDPFHGEGC